GEVQMASSSGAFSLDVDLGAIPHPQLGLIPVQPGETWHFQAWHRDSNGGVATSNFTDAAAIQF
ncbi:MAG: hypothetical protein AAGG01_06995, partial [Planctomycetota bacterium]